MGLSVCSFMLSNRLFALACIISKLRDMILYLIFHPQEKLFFYIINWLISYLYDDSEFNGNMTYLPNWFSYLSWSLKSLIWKGHLWFSEFMLGYYFKVTLQGNNFLPFPHQHCNGLWKYYIKKNTGSKFKLRELLTLRTSNESGGWMNVTYSSIDRNIVQHHYACIASFFGEKIKIFDDGT